jgi:hypothetical protein
MFGLYLMRTGSTMRWEKRRTCHDKGNTRPGERTYIEILRFKKGGVELLGNYSLHSTAIRVPGYGERCLVGLQGE